MINTLHVSTIFVIAGLGFASGYTTFMGMSFYINPWIAMIITIGVQFIIIISAYELSNIYFLAHKLRFLGLFISLLIGLAISINFSYVMFYSKSHGHKERIDNFENMDKTIQNYHERVNNIKGEMINTLKSNIKVQEKKHLEAYLGTSDDLPSKYKKIGPGPFSDFYASKLEQENDDLKKLEARFADYDDLNNKFNEVWGFDELQESANYATIRKTFSNLTSLVDNIISGYGRQTIPKPVLVSWEDFTKINPPYAFLTNLAFYLAVIIDLLSFIFSSRLRILPVGELSEEEKKLAYWGVKEFNRSDLSPGDQLQIGINKTFQEETRDYNDTERKYVIAMLISKGYLRRVDKDHVEFTQRLYDIFSSCWIDENNLVQEKSTDQHLTAVNK